VRLIESSATLIARALEQAASLRNIRMSRHETIYDEGKRFGSLSEVAMPQPPRLNPPDALAQVCVPQLGEFRAAVWIPHLFHNIMFRELYRLGMPLFVPALPLLASLPPSAGMLR
jgi:hypothetical protein